MESKLISIKNATFVCVAVISAAMAVGCGGGGQSTNKEAAAPAAADPNAWRPTGNEGNVTGKVSFQGQPPKYKPLLMEADAVCAKKHSGPVFPEAVSVNADGTLRNVFVYVKSGLEGKTFAVPDEPVTLDQEGCLYKPHVLGIQARQKLKITTSDSTSHNVHPLPRQNREWNVSQAANADPIMQSFDRPEVKIPVKCNQHPWMKAYIHVLSHPFYAVTGEDGSFQLRGLPPGKYEIEAVHEEFGAVTQPLEVAANQTASTDFTFKAGQKYGAASLQMMPAMALACCGGR